MKNIFSPIRASWWVLGSFRPPEPKNVWFLLYRHHVRQVHEKFSSRRFERGIGCLTHFRLLSPKTFDSYFLVMMYVQFMKNFFWPIRARWWVLDSFRPPEPKKFGSYLVQIMYVEFMKNYFLADLSERMVVRLITVSWAPKTFDSYLLDMLYVEFMKKFLLADSCDVMGIRLTSASWAQKRFIPTF